MGHFIMGHFIMGYFIMGYFVFGSPPREGGSGRGTQIDILPPLVAGSPDPELFPV